MKYMSLKNMTEEEKKARKRKQKNEAQKRYYQKHKEYYKNYNKEHNFYKDKCENLQSKIDKAIEFVESMEYCGQEDYFYDKKSKDPCGNDNTFNDSKNKLLSILKEDK